MFYNLPLRNYNSTITNQALLERIDSKFIKLLPKLILGPHEEFNFSLKIFNVYERYLKT